MEKAGGVKPKMKFLALLPKAAAAIRFQNPEVFSPRREKRVNANKLKSHQNRGFSGPITSEILEEIRNKSKNSRFDEPTSPKISCIGQIKRKKKISKARSGSQANEANPVSTRPDAEKKKLMNSRDMFVREKLVAGRNCDASADRAPSLAELKRFSSGRNYGISKFDWKIEQVSPDDFSGVCDRRPARYYSDDERGDSEVEEDEVGIPFSAPILMGGARDGSGVILEPKKEINLWKRRTMAQPKPLQLNL